MEENQIQKLEWSALEYEEKEQTIDWFWALGIIIIASAVTSIIFENYFFAILIVLGGILLAVFTIKKPEMVSYELNDKGLKIKNRLFPYENIKSFWVQIGSQKENENNNSLLFIKSERLFMPVITIPIEDKLAYNIREIMLSYNISEEEMKEHPGIKILETLGF
ncbi:MAG: hypothetical protein AAB636_01140 [Patescibacteria group bacterium]